MSDEGRGRGRGRGRKGKKSRKTEGLRPGPATNPQFLSQQSQNDRPLATLGSTLQQVTKRTDKSLPKRPGLGKCGKKITLSANFFEVKYKDHDIYHYDVTIEPSKCPASLNRIAIERMVSVYPEVFGHHKPVFDGKKNMYTIAPLDIGDGKKEFDITYLEENERERKLKVTLKRVALISLSSLTEALRGNTNQIPYETMQAMDIALRHLPSLRYVPVGRSFFQPPDIKNAYQLGQGREIWFGYHQSIRPACWKTMINLDISSTTFYKSQPVTDFLNEVLDKIDINENKRPLGDHERIRFSKEVKGLKVEVTHLGNIKRKYKVTGVTKESANEKTFTMEKDGADVDVTVAAYFEERYKVKLRYPYLPCLQVGNPERGCFLPMEVCNIVSGQRCAKKLNDRQTREMIKNTPRSASMRKEEIMKIVNKADFAEDPYLRYFGIEVSTQMAKVEGRILDPPTIEFGQMAQVLPRNGAWNLQDRAFHSAKKINVWVLLVLASSQQCKQRVLMKFADEFVDVCSTAGMSVERKPTHFEYLRPGSTEVVGKQFERVVDTVLNNNTSLDLIIVVLNGKNSCYELIKSLGDTYYGIPTQCVQYKSIEPLRRQTVVNLSLKVNTKLGGINSFIKRECKPKIFEKPVIVLGADVTHPAPGDEQKPSIAAVVGSLDSYPMNYSTSIRVQKNRMEIIAELKDMIKELLIAFRNSTGHKPERIVMYRDGVSEGQFQQVLQHEVKAIREACMMLEKDYEPGITFIVVQKRHHARFFPERHQDAVGTSGNIPPGTTVDSGICHPTEYDFYLCSHAGIKGTSRPAHYHVLWDDNDLKPDELHNLTYMLCHTYVRCTRSVSIPAPAYYAHLAAFRARFHVDYQRDISASSDQGSSSSKKSISETTLKTLGDACRPHKKLSKTIYFA